MFAALFAFLQSMFDALWQGLLKLAIWLGTTIANLWTGLHPLLQKMFSVFSFAVGFLLAFWAGIGTFYEWLGSAFVGLLPANVQANFSVISGYLAKANAVFPVQEAFFLFLIYLQIAVVVWLWRLKGSLMRAFISGALGS